MEHSASLGNQYAQYNTGLMYRDGDGLDINLEKSVYWLKQAADQAFPDAQIDLAIALYQGSGIEQNTQEALRLLQLAEEAGLEKAAKVREFIQAEISSQKDS